MARPTKPALAHPGKAQWHNKMETTFRSNPNSHNINNINNSNNNSLLFSSTEWLFPGKIY